jgi:L-asparaginase
MIKILTTGGTIGGLEYANTEDKSSKDTIDISRFLEVANISEGYSLEHLFDKDSRHITLKDRCTRNDKIKSLKTDQILSTHGTKTMSETAKYLGALQLEKTIVLTGSFILGSKKNTDAAFNLGFAFAALQFLTNGVYLAINGKVFNYDNAVKNIQMNRFEEENE